ncbi:hypothetical protein GN958_ATG03455 [Phytophthora infestans]|uniref:Uncharacterized protein n=1 Tax=Phytophthora infestans TaxID=4787 RepID=A0A8S9V483_PHYIN|nr:hypothetical protein GN958_ATG03455 [Phytophthora infestans]
MAILDLKTGLMAMVAATISTYDLDRVWQAHVVMDVLGAGRADGSPLYVSAGTAIFFNPPLAFGTSLWATGLSLMSRAVSLSEKEHTVVSLHGIASISWDTIVAGMKKLSVLTGLASGDRSITKLSEWNVNCWVRNVSNGCRT